MSDTTTVAAPPAYGLLAEFADVDALLAAANRVRLEGFTRAEAYTPFPLHGLDEAIGHKPTWLPVIIFLGGLIGGATGFLFQCVTFGVFDDIPGLVDLLNALGLNYRMNVGGRPPFSWVYYLPVTFECTVLAASGTAVVGMLALNGLPRPHHPLFGVPQFDAVTKDKLFLCIEAADPKYHPEATREFLASLGATEIVEVPLA